MESVNTKETKQNQFLDLDNWSRKALTKRLINEVCWSKAPFPFWSKTWNINR